ncbi:hypothetical protein KNP414_01486 [Paenibacillus mucilaginosus KNP414]|uniref:Uncharacterized protein n=1 Tax=Paenibacillus mucilaginosus (strain KNP414) TaxID=1036673 RepID=F8FMG7_PAEMK|nr:hypothetical protein KNP414_01486 [Paenibacillus mucilaginosus KNP414]
MNIIDHYLVFVNRIYYYLNNRKPFFLQRKKAPGSLLREPKAFFLI